MRALAVCAVLLPVTGLAAGVTIPNGSPEKATEYYKRLSKTLGIRTPDTILGTNLDEVLEWLGYKGLTATDLENLSPEVLMNLGMPTCGDVKLVNPSGLSQLMQQGPLRPGDILVSRFFAPKIVNIAEAPANRAVGWRKLIRFKARRGSEAGKHLIESATLLFNYVTKPTEAPFAPGARSFNSQLALVSSGYPRKDPSCKEEPCRPLLDSIYWMDFGNSGLGSKLSLQLDASFDARGLQPLQAGKPAGIVSYYVPDGCDSCHGDPPPRLGKPVLNELDTDHWFDRVAPTDDFAQLPKNGIAVLTDAGNDPNSLQFARAFDVIRQLNEEYAQMQARVDAKSFHQAATLTWLKLHEKTPQNRPPIERAIVPALQGAGPGLQWSRDSKEDVELLGMLNRYCFRCHGSIRFSVFSWIPCPRAASSRRSAPDARPPRPSARPWEEMTRRSRATRRPSPPGSRNTWRHASATTPPSNVGRTRPSGAGEGKNPPRPRPERHSRNPSKTNIEDSEQSHDSWHWNGQHPPDEEDPAGAVGEAGLPAARPRVHDRAAQRRRPGRRQGHHALEAGAE